MINTIHLNKESPRGVYITESGHLACHDLSEAMAPSEAQLLFRGDPLVEPSLCI